MATCDLSLCSTVNEVKLAVQNRLFRLDETFGKASCAINFSDCRSIMLDNGVTMHPVSVSLTSPNNELTVCRIQVQYDFFFSLADRQEAVRVSVMAEGSGDTPAADAMRNAAVLAIRQMFMV